MPDTWAERSKTTAFWEGSPGKAGGGCARYAACRMVAMSAALSFLEEAGNAVLCAPKQIPGHVVRDTGGVFFVSPSKALLQLLLLEQDDHMDRRQQEQEDQVQG